MSNVEMVPSKVTSLEGNRMERSFMQVEWPHKEVMDVSNFLTKGEFEQYEKRIDQRLDTIEGKVNDLPSRLDEKIKLHFETMKNTQMKWFIGVLIAMAGLAGRIFGLY